MVGCHLQFAGTEAQPRRSLLRQGSVSPADNTMANHHEDRLGSLPGPFHHDKQESPFRLFPHCRITTELYLPASAAGGVPMLALGAVSIAAMLSDRTMESAKVSLVQLDLCQNRISLST